MTYSPEFRAELASRERRHGTQAKIAKAKQAFERRFGKSVLPLAATEFIHENGGHCVRIVDRETGSWAEYNISGWRVSRMREHDAMI